jgi:hypothetical protein
MYTRTLLYKRTQKMRKAMKVGRGIAAFFPRKEKE